VADRRSGCVPRLKRLQLTPLSGLLVDELRSDPTVETVPVHSDSPTARSSHAISSRLDHELLQLQRERVEQSLLAALGSPHLPLLPLPR